MVYRFFINAYLHLSLFDRVLRFYLAIHKT